MNKVTILLVVAIILVAASTFASYPDNIGIFSTLNGNLQPGRASETWCGELGAPVSPGQPGNMINAASWDGVQLSAQWEIWGMTIDANGATLISDTVNGSGQGQRTYQTGYDGGQFWLSGSGAWTTDDVELSGSVHDFLAFTTITFVGGNPVSQTSNITFTGQFHDCPEFAECVIEFAIANTILVWNSNLSLTMPLDYPMFLCSNCPSLVCGSDASGELSQANDIMLSINCAVASEQVSWSSLKDMYR